MSVLVVQHAAAEGPGRIGRAIADAGHALQVVRVDRGEAVPAELGEHAALVVLGGAQSARDRRLPHLDDERRLLADALARDRPILAVCLGSQLLAQVLGGEITTAPRPELGFLPIHLDPAGQRDPLLAGADGVCPLHWHDDVFSLPAGAIALARSAMTAHQAFRHGRHTYGLLFHLECDAAQVAAMASDGAQALAAAGTTAAALTGAAGPACAANQAVAQAIFGAFAGLLAATD
jgi:GMP synthase (glutamine-hydrolysing)